MSDEPEVIEVDAISFDTTDWVEQEREQNGSGLVRLWHNNVGDGMGLYHFAIPPDIPVPLQALDQLRRSYGRSIGEAGGGLVALTVVQLDGLPAIQMIVKTPQAPSGMTYLGSFTIPRRSFSYVLKIQCPEHGITGVRDADVLARALAGGQVQIADSDELIGWWADPYDPGFRGPVLRNLSDDERYDGDFPDHPLSRLRRYLNDIRRSITIADSVKASAEYLGSPP